MFPIPIRNVLYSNEDSVRIWLREMFLIVQFDTCYKTHTYTLDTIYNMFAEKQRTENLVISSKDIYIFRYIHTLYIHTDINI